MTKKLFTLAALPLSLALVACAPVETKTTLTTPNAGKVRTAGPGDTVMSFQSKRALPNAFGRADLFGRTTNAGRTTVRYIGSRGSKAIFERSDIIVDSNATTMSETPLIIPHTTNTNIEGSIGNVPVSGTAASTSYQVIGPRGSSQYASAQRPIQLTIGTGQSVTVEGKTLRVLRVAPSSVSYVIE